MGNRIGNITSKSVINGYEDHLKTDCNDSVLFETISGYMKGWLDIEDVKNDPSLSIAKEAAGEMIIDHNKNNNSGNKEGEKFIRGIFSLKETEEKLAEEIESVKKEISENKLDEITAGWVRDWQEKKLKTGVTDHRSEEIRDFITSAFSSQANEPLTTDNEVRIKRFNPGPFVRYATISAAALIGTFILIRTLLPSSDPEKLFNRYYKPFNAISPVTRSINNTETINYTSAIENYKTANYQKAAIGFTSLMEKDPSVISIQFFLGLSQLELKNYVYAIQQLTVVANASGEFGKEARWYLGLTYLKTGNRQKARECFENLARSDGFYRDLSEKILRRLK